MNVNVTCEIHNIELLVVREMASNGDMEVTVLPCPECLEDAKEKNETND